MILDICQLLQIDEKALFTVGLNVCQLLLMRGCCYERCPSKAASEAGLERRLSAESISVWPPILLKDLKDGLSHCSKCV